MKEAFESKISHHSNLIKIENKDFYVIESKIRFKIEEKLDKMLLNIYKHPFILLNWVPDFNVNSITSTIVDENNWEIRIADV